MEPPGAGRGQPAGDGDGIGVVHRLLGVVALVEAHAAPAAQVDGREQQQRIETSRV
jgi:hypothetical protein